MAVAVFQGKFMYNNRALERRFNVKGINSFQKTNTTHQSIETAIRIPVCSTYLHLPLLCVPIKKAKGKNATFNEFYIVQYWKIMVTSKRGSALIVLLTNGEVGIKDTIIA